VRKREKTSLIFFFVLATIPLLFGARHPLVQGLYTVLLLVTSGSWFILNYKEISPPRLHRTNIPPVLVLCFIFFTALPLPLFLVQILSPVRAGFLVETGTIAQLNSAVYALSYYAPGTRLYAVYLLTLLFFFYFAANLFRSREHQTTALWIITCVGLFEALYGLLQATNPSIGVLWLPSVVGAEGTSRGTIIYRNQYAAFMNMCWPMTLVLGIRLYRPVIEKFAYLKKKKKKPSPADRLSLVFQKAALPFWSAAFMILAVIFSRSRGGILVMLVIAALILILLPFSRRVKGLTGGAFLLFMAAYGGMIGFTQVTDRFLVIYDGALGRILLWLDSLSMLKDHLLTGIGMGAYQFMSPVYLHNVPGNAWYDFAHNEYVELAIELGLPVAALLLLWMIWGMTGYALKIKKALDYSDSVAHIPDSDILAIGSFCAITGFMLHALSDFIWRLPVNAVYAVTLLAMLRAAISAGTTDEKH
jgi:O-antigen ligase